MSWHAEFFKTMANLPCKYCEGTLRQPGFSLGPSSLGSGTYPCVHCWFTSGPQHEKGRLHVDFQDTSRGPGKVTGEDGGTWRYSGPTNLRDDHNAGGTTQSVMAAPVFCPGCGAAPANEKCKLICRNGFCEMFGTIIENCSGD